MNTVSTQKMTACPTWCTFDHVEFPDLMSHWSDALTLVDVGAVNLVFKIEQEMGEGEQPYVTVRSLDYDTLPNGSPESEALLSPDDALRLAAALRDAAAKLEYTAKHWNAKVRGSDGIDKWIKEAGSNLRARILVDEYMQASGDSPKGDE